jgi:hypothetical protein
LACGTWSTTAWDHRELDSPLATIVIDKIRSYERRRRNST